MTSEWPHSLFALSSRGQLMAVLQELPRTSWSERGSYGWTLLHFAALGDNADAAAALLAHGVDVNAHDALSRVAAHLAARGAASVLKVLCDAGADLRALDTDRVAPLDEALERLPFAHDCLCVLMARGVRLSTARAESSRFITPEVQAFEWGVLRCRAATIALLRVKRAGRLVLWERFLLVAMARSVWATRCAAVWRAHLMSHHPHTLASARTH